MSADQDPAAITGTSDEAVVRATGKSLSERQGRPDGGQRAAHQAARRGGGRTDEGVLGRGVGAAGRLSGR